jgi:hypothetical protein
VSYVTYENLSKIALFYLLRALSAKAKCHILKPISHHPRTGPGPIPRRSAILRSIELLSPLATTLAQRSTSRARRLAATAWRSRPGKYPIFTLRTNGKAPVTTADRDRSSSLSCPARSSELSLLIKKPSEADGDALRLRSIYQQSLGREYQE